jgi:hypothetical protein
MLSKLKSMLQINGVGPEPAPRSECRTRANAMAANHCSNATREQAKPHTASRGARSSASLTAAPQE